MKRLFVAIKLEADKNFLATHDYIMSNLKHESIKWVDTDKLHLTLKFLGETPEDKIPIIDNLLKTFVQDKETINISFDKTGIFGSSYLPKVIWFGIKDDQKIKDLGGGLLEYFHKNGFPQDRQNFVPHLTIGRIRKLDDKKHFQLVIDKVKDNFLQEFKVDEIVLYQSILKASGPTYIELGKYGLRDQKFKGSKDQKLSRSEIKPLLLRGD